MTGKNPASPELRYEMMTLGFQVPTKEGLQKMTIHIPAKQSIGAWVTHASCFAIALLLTTAAQAQNQYSAVYSDGSYVETADDAYVGDLEPEPAFEQFEGNYENDIAQVGCFSKSSSCDGCGKAPSCCRCIPWWAHRTGGFGQFLLLRPGNLDQIYAIEQNSVIPGDDPTGPVGRVNIDEEAGFRIGFALACNDCSSVTATFTRFSGDSFDQITAQPGDVLNSQIIHPSEVTTGATSLQSSAGMELDFQLIDLAFRQKWKACNTYVINWLAGFRYGNIEQDFIAQQNVATATGLVTNTTAVDFNGFGMLFGLDGERRFKHHGLSMYGRGISSFLAGNWTGNYNQQNQFGGGVIANEYEDYRVTPVAELELGFAWTHHCGRWRANVGYMTSAWYNSVTTRQYIDAVRNTDYVSLDETITFNGLTAGIEGRF